MDFHSGRVHGTCRDPAEKQTRLAATWLSDTAKIWYINTYKNVKPLPLLEPFLKAFKEQPLTSHSKADVIKRAESIRQGTQCGANEYSTEFKMLVQQLGHETAKPNAWVSRHYLRSLDKAVREGLIPHLQKEDSLDDLIKRAANIARNVEFRMRLDQGSRSTTPRSYGITPPRSYGTTPRSSTPPSMSTTSSKSASGKPGSFTKLTNEERKYLDEHHGCYWYRKINVDHMSRDCPDRIEAERKREARRANVNALEAVVESDSDPEYSRSSVPTIKVVSKVRIPKEKWESSKPAELLVAPLQDNDVILGMPFLVSENVLIDPAHGKVILPTNEGNKEGDMAEEEDEDGEDFDWGYYPAVYPSICPKMLALPKLNLDWIAAVKDFDITQASDKDTSTAPSTLREALRLNKNYLRLNEMYIYEFDNVFTDKLPNKLPSPNAPRHRIILEDEKMSVNGRMFRLPTRYWPLMRDFLDEHLAAGRIQRSSSHITSGTWMIPKDDPNAMPRVVHDYCAINAKTLKDHTPLTHQDDIIERLAMAKIRGKIDLICAYYQILMEICDIHKTAFKTPFGT